MGFFNRWSLRTRLYSMIGLVVLLLGSSSLFGMFSLYTAYKEDSADSLSDMAINLDRALEAQFFERYGDVQAFAFNESVMSMDGKRMQPSLDSYVGLYGLYDVILVVDKNGKYVGSNAKDVAGKTVNQEELKKYDYAQAPWFKAAMAGQFTEDSKNGYAGTYFEDAAIDQIGEIAFGEKRVLFGFTATIKDASGKIQGVVTNRASTKWVDYDMKLMYQTLKESGYPSSSITLVNKDGFYIGEMSPEQYKDDQVHYDPDKILMKKNIKERFPDLVDELKNGKSGHSFSHDLEDGGNNVVGYRHIGGAKWIPSIGWSILIHEETDVVLQHANLERNIFFITFGIGVLIALFIATIFGMSLSKKIGAITEVLSQNSSDLSQASAKVATSSTQLSEGSTEQAAALQETVAAVDEISAMVDKNAEAANRSKDASAHSRDAAMKGRQNVDAMIEAIQEISHSNDNMSSQIQSSNQQLTEITKLISDIGNKTKVINEIVFQTKLLSFNASVEAARAGEYGKGFAVVAEEVGNLAQMSGNAAKEITTLLEESVAKVQTIVEDSKSKVERLMSQSQAKVQLGADTAKSCNESLEEILAQVSTVDSLVSEIAVASQEQATGIREIAKAVGQMEEVTQQNSSVAEASSVAADQLNAQSVQLNQLVQDLRIVVAGNATVEPAKSGPNPPKPSKVTSLKEFKNKTVAKKKAPKPPEPTDGHAELPAMKKVSGDEYVPSSSDPGFEE